MTNRAIFYYMLGMILMALSVVVSNILVQFLFGNFLTWGAFTYPFVFLITDIMNRVYGVTAARRVVFVGFITGILCSFIATQIQDENGALITFRIALGSGIAFLSAQLLDIAIFNCLKNKQWWCAPLASSILASSLDTVLFFWIAFSAGLVFIEPANDVGWANEIYPLLGAGVHAPLWVSLSVADWYVKIFLTLTALIPFRFIVANLLSDIAKS